MLLVTANHKRQRLYSVSIQLHELDESLNMTSSDTILSVFVDNILMWSDHVKHITKEISSSNWLLSRIRYFLSQSQRIQFY